MWIEKLFAGVLRVLTPLGSRYIRPSLAQRIYLLWVFRHFHVLPLQVLTPRQRRLIDALCVEPHFVSLTDSDGWEGSDPRNPGTPPAGCFAPPLRQPDGGRGVAIQLRPVQRRAPLVRKFASCSSAGECSSSPSLAGIVACLPRWCLCKSLCYIR